MADPDPTGPAWAWRTYREALLRTPEDCTHRVVIQDDALPVVNLEAAVAAQVADCPCRVLVLFVSGQARHTVNDMYTADREGESFCRLNLRDHFIPAVAVVWPREFCLPVVEWADKRKWNANALRSDDAILREAAHSLGLEVWVTVPSLVDHVDDVPSVMVGGVRGGKSRRAAVPHPSLR